MDWIIVLIGLVVLMKGIPHLLFPKQVRITLRNYLKMPNSTLRTIGLLGVVVGLIIGYIGFFGL